ncbi:class I SAM-dependent methyltransferase [Methanobrevibacter olleyae]|uniref:tRNA(Phe) (4-demethylwyosine(37)-C(7)) aminocarboxypropyltransferase n=1 Tax=Methanobrevibacter olleyae TaxID=294671 RepID=A0A126R0S2_METOL|nr:class I SAM-dependent methyltransferase family protein [Methanobrevibacter olleyae]AMK15970.1 Met-10+ like-protein [Methanobrevibacter olleyae]SFL16544.1 tRNA wybutosine-synthesizing protein 2 [Methanobrevibacter olleyae]
MKWKKIGDILIVDNKFSDDSEYGLEAIALKHKVKSIIKIDKIEGKKREPTISLLYGQETETIHKENGCLFNLDLSKVMWAKGNNNERLRIAKLVQKDELVLDMFAGIGYFSIPIGVHSQAKQIYSIEINPNSFYFLKNNIELNKINKKAKYDRMIPILGDCAIEAPKYSADRIIMGYVKTTHKFLKPAMECVRDGGIIHYHETVPEKLIESRPYERVKKLAYECGEREVEVLNIQHIKKYSPGVDHIVLDAKIH